MYTILAFLAFYPPTFVHLTKTDKTGAANVAAGKDGTDDHMNEAREGGDREKERERKWKKYCQRENDPKNT